MRPADRPGGALSRGLVQDHAPSPNPMIDNMLSLVCAPDGCDGIPLPCATRDAPAARAPTLDVAGFDEAFKPAVA